MLYAFKHELTYRTARQILSVRERELRFYTRNILTIGAQAALLAGFAFKTLVSHNSADMLEWITEFAPEETFAMLYKYPFQLDAVQWVMTVFELFYLLSTISAMGSTLYTLYICLITPIMGLGLALRGNEGSVDRAVLSLAGVNASVIREFGVALRLFQFSVLMKAFLTFHLVAACASSVSVIYYYFSIRGSEKRIITTFAIPPDQIVTGRFDGGAAATRWDSTRQKLLSRRRGIAKYMPRSAANRAGSTRGSVPLERSASMNDMNFKDPYTQERKERTHGAAVDHEKEKPSNIARRMMLRVQGPLPPTNPADAIEKDTGILPKCTGI